MNSVIAIIGCGNVGSLLAYKLYTTTACDIILVSHNKVKAYSNYYDIRDAQPFVCNHNISVGDYSDIANADVVINCAGDSSLLRSRNRLSEFDNSKRIANDIINNLNSVGFNGIFINVMNPCDEVTYLFRDLDIVRTKILGTGTLLETLRLRRIVHDEYGILTNSCVVGNHGVNNLILWDSDATNLCIDNQKVLQKVRNRVWKIYEGKGFTNFGIVDSVLLIVNAIIHDLKEELCVSTHMGSIYGVDSRCISIPCVVGSEGIVRVNRYDNVQYLIDQLFKGGG